MSRAERRITTAVVVLPFAGFCVGVWRLWGGLVTMRDIAILIVMYSLAGFGITIGFHRHLSHRSFDTPNWVGGALASDGVDGGSRRRHPLGRPSSQASRLRR
jgi:stearoyl-CoA desaturase (Delta-9 desaturase)